MGGGRGEGGSRGMRLYDLRCRLIGQWKVSITKIKTNRKMRREREEAKLTQRIEETIINILRERLFICMDNMKRTKEERDHG